jgi:hypothetical protein
MRSDKRDSNTTSRKQLPKAQPGLSSLTDGGIRMDCNDKQRTNGDPSIRLSLDSDSNVNDERELQHEKELSSSDTTEAGRQIDSNEKQLENA